MDGLEDVDNRSQLFLGLTAENLAQHVATYPRTATTPTAVAGLLAESRRTFVGAAVCYDNFTTAAFKALQAAELALRVHLGRTEKKETLGQLLAKPDTSAVLSRAQLAWFDSAVHFRNKLAHPKESLAFTPGMADPFVRSAHEIITQFFPDG